MAHVVCSGLAYGYQGGDLLFEEVGFRLSPGSRPAWSAPTESVRAPSSPCWRVSCDRRRASFRPEAESHGCARISAFVKRGRCGSCSCPAPLTLRGPGAQIAAAEQRLAAGDDDAGMGDSASRSETGRTWADTNWKRSGTSPAGARSARRWQNSQPTRRVAVRRRAQAASSLDLLLASDADVLLLDEPDNFLDIPAKLELGAVSRDPARPLLLISHDRDLLASTAAITSSPSKAAAAGRTTAHTRATPRHGPRARQNLATRSSAGRRRSAGSPRADAQVQGAGPIQQRLGGAGGTRRNRGGGASARAVPPPAPVVDGQIEGSAARSRSARRVLVLEEVGLEGLLRPLSEEIYFGERVGVVGLNGAGKTHLMRVLAGELGADRASSYFGLASPSGTSASSTRALTSATKL